LEQISLPRGGTNINTQAVGRVQFGMPPETIKDSMQMGFPVPTVYIVPTECFCREYGPALGVNLAEFEFPAYFNFFILKRSLTLVVDSPDMEMNIRRVFGETLLGPAQFRRKENSVQFEEEDFSNDYPRETIPNLAKELEYFRWEGTSAELRIEKVIKFCHFSKKNRRGMPPPLPDNGEDDEEDKDDEEETDFPKNSPITSAQSRLFNLQMERDVDSSSSIHSSVVAIVYPANSSPKDIESGIIKRVEIFKVHGGSEYILHDIDENNIIVGRARFNGYVRISEGMKVAGFRHKQEMNHSLSISQDEKPILPPSFHAPSFGVTILGNSHGFDASASTSGYVLWVNGRGILIDPPPYSNATLDREGIRPRTIVGIILTHCHADHDAGAFQKVLTGSQVVVITTPTIYNSFIRKYSALSSLSPALLRHTHSFKPAIIGELLRFQGALFDFKYTLHSIPCLGFRVEWQQRSMVFTGDHLNNPPIIESLFEKGILSRGRADDLLNIPLQDCDLLLHESGVPPLHTPLDVLLALPQEIKDRTYIVHSSSLPKGCELKLAPTGIEGTIRLDQLQHPITRDSLGSHRRFGRKTPLRSLKESQALSYTHLDSGFNDGTSSICKSTRGGPPNFQHNKSMIPRDSAAFGTDQDPPLVLQRINSTTDSWFMLNLLSSVPFLTSLSYAATMDVLDRTIVTVYCVNEVIICAEKRPDTLCVVWEGTCMERERSQRAAKPSSTSRRVDLQKRNSAYGMSSGTYNPLSAKELRSKNLAVWHAGDWTGPKILQPEKHLSGESSTSKTHDVVAISDEGVKVIKIVTAGLYNILKNGSPLFRRYLANKHERPMHSLLETTSELHIANTNLMELFQENSTFSKFSSVQKRHLESLAEGPVAYKKGERMWRAGSVVDRVFIIMAGTATFISRRLSIASEDKTGQRRGSLGLDMVKDAIEARKDMVRPIRTRIHIQVPLTFPPVIDHPTHSPGF